MKKILLVFAVALCLFCFPFGISAEEAVCSDVIVDLENHTVKFIYENEYTGVFNDIPDCADYNMFVSYLKQIGVVKGDAGGNFYPDREVTRAEFVSMLHRLADVSGKGTVPSGKPSFTEVNLGERHESDMAWAVENKIVNEDQNGNFQDDQAVTKEEALVMIDRLSEVDKGHLKDYYCVVDKEQYDDFDEVSDWAKEAVEEMISVGVLDRYDTSVSPVETLSRKDAAELLAIYHLLNDRPTIVSDFSAPIEYVDPGEQIIIDAAANEGNNRDGGDEDEDYCEGLDDGLIPEGEVPPLVTDDTPPEGATPSWATDDHFSMLKRSFAILATDNNNYKTPIHISNLSVPGEDELINSDNGKLSSIAQDRIRFGSKAPDHDESARFTDSEIGDVPGFTRHYYKYHSNLQEGIGTSKGGIKKYSAYKSFNNHYYNATVRYANHQYFYAYESLGRSIHYLGDINAPYHAQLIANTKENNNEHKRYEAWVKNHFISAYWEWGTAKDSYPFVKNSSFRYMSNSFSKAAFNKYPDCKKFTSQPSVARSATAELTKRTQRAVAALLYRFLCDTGRAN